MNKCFRTVVMVFFLCQPMIGLAGQDEKKALMEYLGGDSSRLKYLLAPDFQYFYFIGDTKMVLSRDQDIEAMERIAPDTVDHKYLAKIDRIHEYKSHSGQFRVEFGISFHDSPKIWPGSFFRGVDLDIDQTFIVKLEQGKIVQIEEKKGKKSNELLLGRLKSIYLRKLEIDGDSEGNVLRLIDSDSHEILVWKKYKRDDYYFYWPNNQLIENFYGNTE